MQAVERAEQNASGVAGSQENPDRVQGEKGKVKRKRKKPFLTTLHKKILDTMRNDPEAVIVPWKSPKVGARQWRLVDGKKNPIHSIRQNVVDRLIAKALLEYKTVSGDGAITRTLALTHRARNVDTLEHLEAGWGVMTAKPEPENRSESEIVLGRRLGLIRQQQNPSV